MAGDNGLRGLPPQTPASGFVLAGGHSRRMGSDKALLPWEGGTLLSHALDRLRRVCADVAVACGSEPRYAEAGVPVVTDVVREAGPLGGLITALTHARAPLALLLAVDLPFVSVEMLSHLVTAAVDVDAVVPVAAGGPQPLCAVYRTTCLAPARRRLDAGEYKMTSFWPDVRVREVSEAELTSFGDPQHLLSNLNTWQDYEGSGPGRR